MGVAPLVAVVDDDAGVRKALARLLRANGYQVETYGSAEQFLGRPPGALPDCLLLDINLERMSGLDLYERLRELQGQPPVVFITGRDQGIVEEVHRRAPGRSCLLKPFDDSVLLDAIGRAVLAA
jgi:FixJ family two-component response regulator